MQLGAIFQYGKERCGGFLDKTKTNKDQITSNDNFLKGKWSKERGGKTGQKE